MADTIFRFSTKEEYQARLWMNAGRMYGVLHDLLFGDFHRVLYKREHKFKKPDEVAAWVLEQIQKLIEEEGLSEFMDTN